VVTTDPIFRDAQALAAFANLEPARVDYFRNNFAEFMPEGLWGGQSIHIQAGKPPSESMSSWQSMQDSIRELWRSEFPMENVIQFTAGIQELALGIKHLFAEIRKDGVESIINGDIVIPKPQVFGCQRGATFLAIQPWRARTCVCGNRFVAAVPASRFCSDKCFQASRRHAKKAWWSTNGTDWRNGKTKKKGTKKSPKKGKR
jgi:hypothetical protein